MFTIEASKEALDYSGAAVSHATLEQARFAACALAQLCGERVKVRDAEGREVCHFNYDGSED